MQIGPLPGGGGWPGPGQVGGERSEVGCGIEAATFGWVLRVGWDSTQGQSRQRHPAHVQSFVC